MRKHAGWEMGGLAFPLHPAINSLGNPGEDISVEGALAVT